MRIVIATPFYPPQDGVLAMYASGLAEAFRNKGHTVEILLPSRAPLGIRHVLFFLRALIALRGASFLLSLDTWSVGVPASFAARLCNVPFLVRVGGDHLWEQYLERTHEPVRLSEFYAAPRKYSARERFTYTLMARILASAHAVMFNTQFQKDIWSKAYRMRKALVLENFYPEKRSERELHSSRVFLSAHRGAWYKNIDTARAAIERVKKHHPEVTLDTRYLPHSEQLKRIAASYAVIIPSISEVGSNLAIEAVAAGKPFIMSEDTGTRERLQACGLFIDTRSVDALEQAIESVLDPRVYAALAKSAEDFRFTRSWVEIVDEILDVVR